MKIRRKHPSKAPGPVISSIEHAAAYSKVEKSMRPGGISVYSEEFQYMKVLFGTPWGPEGWGISNYVAVDERSNTPYWISTQYDGQIAAQSWYLDKKELTFDTVTEYARRISPTMYHAAKGIGPDNWRKYIPGLKAAQEKLQEEKQAPEDAKMRKKVMRTLVFYPGKREILEQMDISADGISAKTKDGYPSFQIDTSCVPSPSWKLYRKRNQAYPYNFRSNLKKAIRALAVCIEITQCGDDPKKQSRKETLEKRLDKMLTGGQTEKMRKRVKRALLFYPGARSILEQMDILDDRIRAKTEYGFPQLLMDTHCTPAPNWRLRRFPEDYISHNFYRNSSSAIWVLAICIEIRQCGDDPAKQSRKQVLEKRLDSILMHL